MVRTVGSDRRAVRFKEQYTGNGRYAGTKDRRTWQPVRGTAAPQRIASGKGGEPETAPQGARRPSMSLRTVLFMLFIIAAMTGLLLYYIKLQADVTRTSREIADLEQKLTQMQAENDATKQELNNELVAQREFANTTAEKFAQMQEEMRVQRTQMQNEIADLKSANTAEIQKLTAALETAESKVRDQEVKYTEMSNRLNKALADKVAELKDASAYQSDFYRAIKIALGNSKAVQQDGDRFIISSDILFPSGSYKLSPEGKTQLQLISNVIKDFETKIPSDVNWIIRVDGHTDNKPVIRGTRAYRNNMQLSLLRATAVADELARDGVSRNRLIPTGFGDMDPISTGTTPTDLQKNRRIELQLTNK